jgi:hypothetical protein
MGSVAGGLGQLLVPDRPAVTAAAIAVCALFGAALDAHVGGLRLPTIRRQVDERWLQKYRGWVYGVGFGAQLGTGLVTIVSSAAVYVMVIAALLTRSIAYGALIGTIFGLVRGLSILLAWRVTTPDDLRRFHRRLAAQSGRSERLSAATQGLIGTAGLLFVVVVR